MDTFGERFSVSAIVGKTMQRTWLLLFVVDRRNSQIIKISESSRIQHRKLRPRGCNYQTAGKWGACGWSVVQLDYDEELGPLHGMYGSLEAEVEVQRTIKRAELTAFFCLLTKVIGPIKVHVDNK